MNITQLEQDITKILEALDKAKHDPQFALQCANSLSTLMFNLSPMCVTAQEDANRADRAYKDLLDSELIRMRGEGDKTVAESEAIARRKGKALFEEYLIKQSMAQKLKMLREDIDRRISLLQSWASELRSQKVFRGSLSQ